MTNNQIPINLTDFKSRLQLLIEFCAKMEEDIFVYDEIKDMSIDQKVEYYKLAKNSLLADLNFAKQLPDMALSAEDELIKNVILSLPKEEKLELKKILIDLSQKKSKLDSKK